MENSKFKIQKLKWFIITFYLLLFSSNMFAQDSTKVTDMTADTSPAAAGVFYYVESSTDKQITWGTLTSAIRDSLENNTFYTVTFIGATFSAGSNGTVTIADSLLGTGRQWFAYLNPYSATSFIGDYSNPFLRIYSKNFVLVSTAGSDSAYITYDGTEVSIDQPLSVANLTVESDFTMDSSANFVTFNFQQNQYTIPSVGDTILTLTTSDLYSSTELDLPGNVTPGISKLQIDTAPVGMVLRFYNGDASYSIIFEDAVSGDDNMYMEGDFTMGQYDNIEFECIDATKGSQKWMEVRRKNN